MLSLGRADRERERERDRDRERDRITVKIRNMKRSSSRDSVPRVKRSRSSAPRYTDSSEERDRERDRDRDRDRDRLSPERLRRRRSPSPASRRYSPRREEYLRTRDPPDRHYLYKVLCVSSLHPKASDEAVKDTLYREYKKFGDLSVKVSHEVEERVAYVYFRSTEDARDAKHAKPRIILFDKVAIVEPVYERVPTDYRRGRSATPPDYERYTWSPTPSDRRRLLPEHERIYAMTTAPHPHPHAHPHPSAPALHRDFRPHEYPLPTALHPHPHPHPHPHAHPLHRPPLHPHPHAHAHYLPRAYAPRPHHAPFDKPENKKDKFPNYLHHVQPEDDPLATRTLFAGNLEINISDEELRRIFGRYGIVEDIDIKRPQPGTGNAFAFVRYQTLDMAHRAKVELSGQYIGKFQCKIGYGKVTPTTRIWVGGLGPWTSVPQLEREFDRFGAIKKIEYVKGDTSGYILYDSIDAAQAAVKEMRGFPLGGADKRLRIDFADAAAPGGNGAPASAPPYRKFAEPERDYDPPPWDESYALALRRSRPRPPRARGPEDEWRRGERRSGSAGSARRSDSDSDSGCGGARRAGALAAARTLPEVARKSDCSWCGALVLKNSLFPAKFHLTDGDPDIVESLMRDEDGKNQLRITQRLRLDQPKLDDVQKRISTCSSHAIFLGLAGSTASVAGEDSGIQTRPLRNLVSYLKQKEAAGVISLLNKETEATGVLYSFPPCNFSTELLKRTCHNLTEESLKDDHLVIVVVKGGTA